MQKTKIFGFKICDQSYVDLTSMGNILQIVFQTHKNNIINFKKLNKDEYMLYATGEVLCFTHTKNRSENISQLYQSMRKLREYINTNVTDTKKCKWITLTYKENMSDPKKLYKDFEKFIKKVRYKFKDYCIEYIAIAEPQARGAWHLHLLLLFDKLVPFIPNKTFEILWGHGFTKTNDLKNVDNVGAYLTAYLTDLEFTETNLEGFCNNPSYLHYMTLGGEKIIKEVDTIAGKNLPSQKKFVKGARLYLYPPGFHFYRCSKGIKKPTVETLPYFEAKKRVGSAKPTFSSCVKLFGQDFEKTISYEYYNLLRM